MQHIMSLSQPSVDCRDDIEYHVHVRELYDIGYGFDFSSLGNFPLLEKVIAHINCEGARCLEVEEAETAMRHAVEAHPNQPILQMERHDVEKMKVMTVQAHDPSSFIVVFFLDNGNKATSTRHTQPFFQNYRSCSLLTA